MRASPIVPVLPNQTDQTAIAEENIAMINVVPWFIPQKSMVASHRDSGPLRQGVYIVRLS